MKCRWDALLGILPQWMRQTVDERGKDDLRELRLRLGKPPELILGQGSFWLSRPVTGEDLTGCIHAASRYSPWAAATMDKGYITAPGGHRMGLCGTAVYRDGVFSGLREVESVCIRVARDFPGIGEKAPMEGSVLILGAPGWGKTTLLRDLIRRRSRQQTVAVVDERGELFPPGFDRGRKTDVLTGAEKRDGIHRLLRTMAPEVIAVDEISEEGDCAALLSSAHCGVELLATAHAADYSEFRRRGLYRKLLEQGIFDHVLTLKRDKTYDAERMRQ